VPKTIKIGNAQGFWGDSVAMRTARKLLAQQPDLDYLTLDYLAEVSLSIHGRPAREGSGPRLRPRLHRRRAVARPALESSGSTTKIVCNAGGLNPLGCAERRARLCSQAAGITDKKVGLATGDDVLGIIRAKARTSPR
jgi:hypothetical protein